MRRSRTLIQVLSVAMAGAVFAIDAVRAQQPGEDVEICQRSGQRISGRVVAVVERDRQPAYVLRTAGGEVEIPLSDIASFGPQRPSSLAAPFSLALPERPLDVAPMWVRLSAEGEAAVLLSQLRDDAGASERAVVSERAWSSFEEGLLLEGELDQAAAAASNAQAPSGVSVALAREQFERALDSHDGNAASSAGFAGAHLALARLNLMTGDVREATVRIDAVLRADPEHLQAWRHKKLWALLDQRPAQARVLDARIEELEWARRQGLAATLQNVRAEDPAFAATSEEYYPLVEGAWWEYHHIRKGVAGDTYDRVTITAVRRHADQATAQVMRETFPKNTQGRRFVLSSEAYNVLRTNDGIFVTTRTRPHEPIILRPLEVGSTYPTPGVEDPYRLFLRRGQTLERVWSIESLGAEVTVPIIKQEHPLRFSRCLLVRGVTRKLRQITGTQATELAAHVRAPSHAGAGFDAKSDTDPGRAIEVRPGDGESPDVFEETLTTYTHGFYAPGVGLVRRDVSADAENTILISRYELLRWSVPQPKVR